MRHCFCIRCSTVFGFNQEFKKHRGMPHTKFCGFCTSSFQWLDELRSHQRERKHGFCKGCDGYFDSPNLWWMHIESSSHVFRCLCRCCGKGFSFQYELDKHLLRHIPDIFVTVVNNTSKTNALSTSTVVIVDEYSERSLKSTGTVAFADDFTRVKSPPTSTSKISTASLLEVEANRPRPKPTVFATADRNSSIRLHLRNNIMIWCTQDQIVHQRRHLKGKWLARSVDELLHVKQICNSTKTTQDTRE